MKLNFKKGFFRLWLLTTALWLIFGGIYFFSYANRHIKLLPTQKDFVKEYNAQLKIQSTQYPNKRRDGVPPPFGIRKDPIIEFNYDIFDTIQGKNQKPEPLEKILSSSVPFTVECLGIKYKFPPNTNPDRMWKAFEPAVNNEKNANYFTALVFTFIPPIALLLIGMATMWVLQGFSMNGNRDNPPPQK